MEAYHYEQQTRKPVKRIRADTRDAYGRPLIVDKKGRPYPNGSIIRKNLPFDSNYHAYLEYNTVSGNLCLYVNGRRKDIINLR